MKAICTTYYLNEYDTTIHNNIIELPKLSLNRRFKCLDFGLEWTENIHSPSVISEDDEDFVRKNFENVKDCKEFI